MSSPDPLSPLRDSIAEVDRALLELLRRRMDLAAEVGRVKAASNLPVVVQDVEDRVLGRARQHAEACGVSEDVMAEMFQAIIRGSVERQYRVGISRREQRQLSSHHSLRLPPPRRREQPTNGGRRWITISPTRRTRFGFLPLARQRERLMIPTGGERSVCIWITGEPVGAS